MLPRSPRPARTRSASTPTASGRALIFPCYTVQSARGSALNTYLSVVNHGSDAKAIRVRFHEGRMGAEVADFNLFLSPNDVWTTTLDFNAFAYSGSRDDGAGSGLDRTLEGYFEMIEMATLTGTAALAVTHNGGLRMVFTGPGPTQQGLTSLPGSTRMDLATGAVTTGPQTYYGLPVVGFTARTFVNGTLACSAGSCQGNHGGAFPFQYTRRISP